MKPRDPDLFNGLKETAFGGRTYDPSRDFIRLKGQLLRVWKVLQDHRWHTLAEIAKAASALRTDGGRDSEAAVSARLRDFRKVKFGAHVLQARNEGGGLWWYRLWKAVERDP